MGWHSCQNVRGIELFQVSIARQFSLDLGNLGLQMLYYTSREVWILVTRAEARARRFGGDTLGAWNSAVTLEPSQDGLRGGGQLGEEIPTLIFRFRHLRYKLVTSWEDCCLLY